jgi:hypothetical protein
VLWAVAGQKSSKSAALDEHILVTERTLEPLLLQVVRVPSACARVSVISWLHVCVCALHAPARSGVSLIVCSARRGWRAGGVDGGGGYGGMGSGDGLMGAGRGDG